MVHNEIFIRMDKGQYVGGDIIYGTVFLNVLHPFTARSLILELKGYEKHFGNMKKRSFIRKMDNKNQEE